MQIGIETEYWVIDTSGRLVSADDIVNACDGTERECVSPLLEIKTDPCNSVPELMENLVEQLSMVTKTAETVGKRLVPLGTPLSDTTLEINHSRRIEIQQAILGKDFSHATHCAGTHIHVEQSSVVDQLRAFTALDPTIALVNTTPYYRGKRLTSCARPHVYRRCCYESLPTHGQLWDFPDTAQDWRDQITDRFEILLDAGNRAGYSRETIKEEFTPETAIWSPVRLRDDLGTVEWRAPDSLPPRRLIEFLQDITRFMHRIETHGIRLPTDRHGQREPIEIPSFDRLREITDTAIKSGTTASVVRNYLAGIGFEPARYRPFGHRIDGHTTIDSALARKLRLQAADLLRRELDQLQRFEEKADDFSRGWMTSTEPPRDSSTIAPSPSH